jgi:hypothetical protein
MTLECNYFTRMFSHERRPDSELYPRDADHLRDFTQWLAA